MKKKCLELLVCPSCRGKMDFEPFTEEEGETKEGLFSCGCGKSYPVVNYVPRMLANALFFHPEFAERHKERLGNAMPSKEEMKKYERLYRQTKERFEFQWKTWGREEKIYGRTREEERKFFFEDQQCREDKDFDFKGKLVLEGGCGHGRYVQMMAEMGAEAFGIDLGQGVEVARERNAGLKNAHIVQADILNLPFPEGIFDYVYSIGVIHHTPDTKKAFSELAHRVKKGGILKIWVYPKESPLWEASQPAIRMFTSRLPPRALYYASYAAVPLLCLKTPYSGTTPGKNTWKECVQCIYDWYSPEYQTHHSEEELAGWFSQEGFLGLSFAKTKAGASGVRAK